MINKAQDIHKIYPKDNDELKDVMNVICPSQEILQSQKHKARVAKVLKEFSNLAFKID